MLPHISPNTYGISGPMLNSKTAVRGGSREAGKAGGENSTQIQLVQGRWRVPGIVKAQFPWTVPMTWVPPKLSSFLN